MLYCLNPFDNTKYIHLKKVEGMKYFCLQPFSQLPVLTTVRTILSRLDNIIDFKALCLFPIVNIQ